MSKKLVLRIVGGPHDGGVYDTDDDVSIVQIGHRAENSQDGVPAIGVATYRRRSIQFDDGSPNISYLCWSEFTDYQAMCFLLKIPFVEAADVPAGS